MEEQNHITPEVVVVVAVESVEVHPNADRLDIIGVLGTQFISSKGDFEVGDNCIYFPPDTVVDPTRIPKEIVPYLKKGNRVGAIRLRGAASFGFGIKTQTKVGTNLTNAFGAIHWQPPEYHGEGRLDSPGVFMYTQIQHYYKHRGVFRGRDVVITEKIHGMSGRVGVCKGEIFCGSHRRLRSEDSVFGVGLPLVRECLEVAKEQDNNLTIYGEIFGKGIQFLDYGTARGFKVFDAMLNGVYMDWPELVSMCKKYDIPVVPVLYEGKFYNELIEEYTDGPSFAPSTTHNIREGIVIKTLEETRSGKLGRLIVKSVSADYYAIN